MQKGLRKFTFYTFYLLLFAFLLIGFQNCNSKQSGALTLTYNCAGSFASESNAVTGDHRVSPNARQSFLFKGQCGANVKSVKIFESDGITQLDELTCENSAVSKEFNLSDELFWGQTGSVLNLYTKIKLADSNQDAQYVESECEKNTMFPVSIDNTVPQLNFDKPHGDWTTTTSTHSIFISGFCDETQTNITVTLNTTGMSPMSSETNCLNNHFETAFSNSNFKMEDRTYNIKVTQFDLVNNKGENTISYNPIYEADTTAPSDPGNIRLGSVPNSLFRTPSISWDPATDNTGGSGVDYYELELLDANGTVIRSWFRFVSGSNITGLNLSQGANYYVKVRAVDRALNMSSGANSPQWTASFVQPSADRITTGGRHACAWPSSQEGNMWCWGDNRKKQVAASSATTVSTPTKIFLPEAASEVALGGEHTCINSSKGIICWGSNSSGQLGAGLDLSVGSVNVTQASAILPPGYDGVHNWRSLVAGEDFTCAINGSDDKPYCWGDNTGGKLGVGDSVTPVLTPRTVANIPSLKYHRLVAGKKHTCIHGVTDPGKVEVYCWGDNTYGQVGNGSVGAVVAQAVSVNFGFPLVDGLFLKLTAGAAHTCALYSPSYPKKEMWCWGDNHRSQLGIAASSATDYRASPAKADIEALPDETYDLVAGFEHTCRVTAKDSYRCVGNNENNQVTFPSETATDNTWKNYRTPGGFKVVADNSYSLGPSDFTCILGTSSNGATQQVACSGVNNYSQCAVLPTTKADKETSNLVK